MKEVRYYHDVIQNVFYKVEGDTVTCIPKQATVPAATDLRQHSTHPASAIYISNEGAFRAAGLTNVKLKV